MFVAHGFQVINVKEADHGVAKYLKEYLGGNLLLSLIDSLCNFEIEFNHESVKRVLGMVVDNSSLHHGLRDDFETFADIYLKMKKDKVDVAVGKSARQSSTCAWSSPPYTDTASRAVDAFFNPDFSFHTDFEDEPWWQVDLEDHVEIGEIHIYNRRQNADRFCKFTISVSSDGNDWFQIFKKIDDEMILDDRNPFIWLCSQPISGRFVRIALVGPGILHLSRVKIFLYNRDI